MENRIKRHWILPVLCILTFLGSGFGFLISILSLVNIEFILFIKQIPTYTSVITHITDSHYSYSIVKAFLFAFSIAGAFFMLKGKLKGFFIYLIAQSLLLVISFFYFPYPTMQTLTIVVPEIIFTIAFFGLYSLHIPYLKQSNRKDTASHPISETE